MITIDKAIEILERNVCKSVPDGEIQHLDATKLGIEALKRVKYYRRFDELHCKNPLPREDLPM